MKLDLQLFASSGSVDTTIAYSSYGNSWGTTSWTQTSNNNGTSTINYNVVFHITTGNYRYVWFNSYVTAYANGSQVDRKSIDSGYVSCGNNTTIFSGSFTITDGASIRFVTDLRIGDSQVGYTSDQTWTSDTYKNTISNNQTPNYLRPVALDMPIAINVVNPSATNEIVITTGNVTITKTMNSDGLISLTNTDTTNIISANTSSSQIGGTITLRTKVNGTIIGTDTKNLTWWYITQDSTTKPTITNATITVSEDNSTVASLTNSEKYIRGYSRQNVSITATFTGQYGATITGVYVNGVLMTGSGNTYQVTLPESEVSNFIGVTAIDSRGFVSEASSTSVDVIDYTTPVLSNVVLERRDGVSEEVELSLTLKLWNGSYKSSTTANNTVYSFKYLVKEHSASTYGSPIDNTTRFRTAISGQSFDNIVLSGFRVYSDSSSNDFDFGTAYDVLIEVFDGLETVQFNSSGQVLGIVDDGLVLDSYKKTSTGYQYGINQVVDTSLGDGLQVSGNLYVNGKTLLDLIYPVNSIYISVSDTNPRLLFGGTWEKISDGRVLQGASTNQTAGTTVDAGLPNITGNFKLAGQNETNSTFDGFSGAFYASTSYTGYYLSPSGHGGWGGALPSFDASRSNPIYGRSSTVQPPAYLVHIWKRVA